MTGAKLKAGVGAAVVLVALLWGPAHAAPAPGSKYVAIGSSYAAGTGLSHVATDSPERCAQHMRYRV